MPWPVDSGGPPHPRPIGCFVLASCTLKHSPSATTLSRSCTSSSGRAVVPTAYRILCLRFACLVSPFGSSTDARLDTGGWLTLTRRGLSPRKIRRAFPGAITRRLRSHGPPASRAGSKVFLKPDIIRFADPLGDHLNSPDHSDQSALWPRMTAGIDHHPWIVPGIRIWMGIIPRVHKSVLNRSRTQFFVECRNRGLEQGNSKLASM